MDIFEKIDNDKKALIIDKALSIFACYGYDKTSVADIAKACGISKASLFQYFYTKKDMYRYLVQYALTKLPKVELSSSVDYFEYLLKVVEIKTTFISINKDVYKFLDTCSEETTMEIIDIVNNVKIQLVQTQDFLNFVDWNKFKHEVSQELVINMTNWLIDGYLRNLNKNKPSLGLINISDYLKNLKYLFYKIEYF